MSSGFAEVDISQGQTNHPYPYPPSGFKQGGEQGLKQGGEQGCEQGGEQGGEQGFKVGGGWGVLQKRSVLGPPDLFRHFLSFFDLFAWIYPIYSLIYD